MPIRLGGGLIQVVLFLLAASDSLTLGRRLFDKTSPAFTQRQGALGASLLLLSWVAEGTFSQPNARLCTYDDSIPVRHANGKDNRGGQRTEQLRIRAPLTERRGVV